MRRPKAPSRKNPLRAQVLAGCLLLGLLLLLFRVVRLMQHTRLHIFVAVPVGTSIHTQAALGHHCLLQCYLNCLTVRIVSCDADSANKDTPC